MHTEARDFEGRSAAEAAIKACEAFGVTRSALVYDVVSDTGEGLARRVVIRARAAEGAAASGSSSGADRPSEGRHSRDSDERSSRGGNRGGSRDRGRGGDRSDRAGGPRGGRDSQRSDRHAEGRGQGGAEAREDDGIEGLLGLNQAPTVPVAHRPELTVPLSAAAEQAKALSNELLRHMGFNVEAHVVQDDAEEIHVDLIGSDENKVIGPKGDVLLSMQFIVNRMVGRTMEADTVVVLDAAGYRERRRSALAELATRLAERAVAEGKAVRLSPMSAHDRRVFHVTLQEMHGVTTRSDGEGLYRRLMIIPSELA